MTENTLSIDFSEMTRAKSVPILSLSKPEDDYDDEDDVISCHGNGSRGDRHGGVGEDYNDMESDRNGDGVKFNVGASSDVDNCLEDKERELSTQTCAESVRVQAVEKLQAELKKAQEALQLKDEQVNKLSSIRNEMDKELEDLTASLFQEAHGMVREANMKRAASEKQRKEAVSKIEVLQAEVIALKSLVITSTPSIHYKKSRLGFHRSHHEKQPFTPTHQKSRSIGGLAQMQSKEKVVDNREIDAALWKDFMAWKSDKSLSRDSKFMSRILLEDIQPCLNFANGDLASGLLNSIEKNTLSMEPIMTSSYPKKCALTGAKKVCKYRFRLSESVEWNNVTSACRERVTAVCDFYTYLRYIQQGLVKAEEKDMYWEIIRLRCEMSLAKLGL